MEGVEESGAVLTPEAIARAEGVVLIGELEGSGYKQPPALVRRADGQMIQLSPLLYLVLETLDGRRTRAEVAAEVTRRFGRLISEDNVGSLITGKLRPLGLVTGPDGSQPELQRSNPLLALRFRYAVTDPDRTRRLTAPFSVLFSPLVVAALLTAFAVVCWWVLFERGLAAATHEAFHRPGLLLLVFAVTVLSAGFHEFGHAAAARYGGATPGAMGMGLYLFWPAFYTDVTDSYRLGRGGRIRTDLGGLYFNAIVAVCTVGVWWITGYDAWLLVVATQILQMIRQLLPTVRFDGYHVLADLTGVPDLYHRIKPTLLGLLPWRWHDPRANALTFRARVVVTLWCLTAVPLMLFSLLLMVLTLPRLVATAWVSLQEQLSRLDAAWTNGELLTVLARGLAIVALVLPVAGIGYLLVRMVRSVVRGGWARTSGKPMQRALAVVTAASLVALLGWAWWPDRDTYRPIAAYEAGTLTDLVSSSSSETTGRLEEGLQSTMRTVWPAEAARPTRENPALALVMVPRDDQPAADTDTSSDSAGDASGAADATSAPPESAAGSDESGNDPGSAAPSWVFPFDQPLPPNEGDSQALAVNTTDDTVTYDLAFALVWVDGDDPVTNTNEAYAFASCTNCAAVAVGFQVVLVVGEADVVVPQNLAGALSYNCVSCLTYALATQLLVTLDRPLSEAGMTALNAVWAEIAEFAEDIADYPLGELQDRLSGFEATILDVLVADGAVTLPTTSAQDPSTPVDTADGQAGVSTPGTATGEGTPSEPVTATPGSTDVASPTPTAATTTSTSTTSSAPSGTTTTSVPSTSSDIATTASVTSSP